jgi:hypothetical protein
MRRDGTWVYGLGLRRTSWYVVVRGGTWWVIGDSGLDKISCHNFAKIKFLSDSKISTDSNENCHIL